jgi:predicted PolB exonuclease-like 3'-5' exonuclease
MNYLVFDIETIPDLDYGKQFLNLDGLEEADIGRAMFFQQLQKTGTEFLPLNLHKVITISVLTDSGGTLEIESLGSKESSERSMIQLFYDLVDANENCLVTWNGLLFDLPVLNYRTLFNQVDAASYWQNERWHIDLKDVLTNHNAKGQGSLDNVAKGLGLPGKINVSGDQVWNLYLEGRVEDIRNYCEHDVLNTYLIFIHYQAMIGKITNEELSTRIHSLKKLLSNTEKQHFQLFLSAWEQ